MQGMESGGTRSQIVVCLDVTEFCFLLELSAYLDYSTELAKN